LPKDLRGIPSWSRRNAIALPMLENVNASNQLQIEQIINNIVKTGKMKIGLIGLAFKDNTDDLRESPMVAIAEGLRGKGREVEVFDPVLNPDRLIGANQNFALSALPHLANMMVKDASKLVEDNDLVILAQAHAVEDFSALPWREDQEIFDLVGLKDYSGMPGIVDGLYWQGNADEEWQRGEPVRRSA
jgi:GDP-mannose 6-dehydrogenase